MRKQIDLDRPRLTWACITKTLFFHLLFEGNNRRPRKNDYLLTKRLNRRSEVVRVNAGAFAQKDTSVFCFTRTRCHLFFLPRVSVDRPGIKRGCRSLFYLLQDKDGALSISFSFGLTWLLLIM